MQYTIAQLTEIAKIRESIKGDIREIVGSWGIDILRNRAAELGCPASYMEVSESLATMQAKREFNSRSPF